MLGDFLVQRRLDDDRHAVAGTGFVAAEGDVVQLGLAFVAANAPLDEAVNQDVHLLGRDEALSVRRLDGHDPVIEQHHVLERWRQLEVQTRFADHFLDLAQCEHDRVFTLIDHENHRGQDQQQDKACDEGTNYAIH